MEKYQKFKYLNRYGFSKKVRIISISKGNTQINNVSYLNVVVEFHGQNWEIPNVNPDKLLGKRINDFLPIKYNSQNSEEFIVL